MPRTLSAIPHFSPRPASRTAAKVLSQPLKDDKTFASLLGGEKPAKTASASKKLSSGAASLEAKTYDDVARYSQSGSDKSASSQAGTSPASDAAIPNQTNQAQFISAVSLASYIPISSTEKDVSVTKSSPSAEAKPASQASRPLLQPTPATKGLRSSTGATAAQDTRTMNSGTRSYETAGDKQASRAPTSVSDRTTATAAVSSSATDTAATSLKTRLATYAPAMDRVPRSPEPALASKLAAAVSSSATDTAATSLKIPLAPDAPAMDRVPKNPKPTLAPKLAAAQMAKSSEAPPSRSPLRDTNSAQSGKITSNANSDGLKISVSDAQSGITSKITMPPSSADPVKASDAVVVVRSQTHFVPEAAKAGDDITGQIATLSSAQHQVVAAGQVTFPPSPKRTRLRAFNCDHLPSK